MQEGIDILHLSEFPMPEINKSISILFYSIKMKSPGLCIGSFPGF